MADIEAEPVESPAVDVSAAGISPTERQVAVNADQRKRAVPGAADLLSAIQGTRYETDRVTKWLLCWNELVYEQTGKPFSFAKLCSQLTYRAESGCTPDELVRDLQHSCEHSRAYAKILSASGDGGFSTIDYASATAR